MSRRKKYYEKIEEGVLDIMVANTGISGLCNVEVCEAILLHVRECYDRFDNLEQLALENERSKPPEIKSLIGDGEDGEDDDPESLV